MDNEAINTLLREHFQELCNCILNAELEVINQIPQRSIRDDMGEPPIVTEMQDAIRSLKNAAGPDRIPAEILKERRTRAPYSHTCPTPDDRGQGRTTLRAQRCSDSDHLQKGKQGIMWEPQRQTLSCQTQVKYLHMPSDCYPGLRKYSQNRSVASTHPEVLQILQIFTVRQPQNKCWEQKQPLYMTFIDLTKAFNTVDRYSLWRIISKYG